MSLLTAAPDQDLAYAQAFQARQVAFLAAGDVDGLLANCYAPDARLHSFAFRVAGHDALRPVLTRYLARLSELGARHVDRFVGSRDFIWLELTIDNPAGPPIQVYEVKFLRDDRIYLQLLGERQGSVWQPGDRPVTPLPDTALPKAFHQRYLRYHQASDADGLADDFFTPDVRLVTAHVDVQGQEAIRGVFRALFARERDFTPGAVHNITHDVDYVWFEASVTSSLGARTVYDVQLVRGDQVAVQLVGQLAGRLPTDAAFGEGPPPSH